MTRATKDVLATGAVAASVVTYVATWQRWDVALVGDSRRWAAVAMLVLGTVACSLGEARESTMREAGVAAVIGSLALLTGAIAVVTGSFAVLTVLAVEEVALWALATTAHARTHHSRLSPVV